MHLTQLILKDFLSFKDLCMDISGVKAIQGENLDDDDQETNGTGKSSIQSGIEFALFATTSRMQITSKDLIRWGCNSSYVQLGIYCPFRDETLLIERTLGKGNKLEITVNSDPLDFATVNDGNAQIINWIGISKEDLQNYFIINKERYSSYYTSSNTKKLQMIGRFSNLSILDSSDDVVNSYAEDLRSDIGDLEYKISVLKGRNLQLEDSINDENSRNFELEFLEKKEAIGSKIVELNDNILKRFISIKEAKDEIKSQTSLKPALNLEISKLNTLLSKVRIPNFNNEIAPIEEEKKLLTAKKSKLVLEKSSFNRYLVDVNKEKSLCENNLLGVIVCPNCEHEFTNSEDINIDEEKEILQQSKDLSKQIEKNILELENKISKVLTNLDSCDVKIKNIKSKILESEGERFSIENKIRKIKRSLSSCEDNISRSQITINHAELSISNDEDKVKGLKEELKNLEISTVDEKKISIMRSNMVENEKTIESHNLTIDELNDSLFYVLQWIYNFKMFRSHLSMDVLDVISGYTNKFLKDLKSDLQVKWEGFKVKSDGTLSDKITPQIVRNGEQHPFGSFSGGERGRLEYANILTSQYLINSTHPFGGLNFLFTDEITEGIDGRGLDNLITALEGLNIPILLTTHVSNNSVRENTLLVRKKDGVSKIVDNGYISN